MARHMSAIFFVVLLVGAVCAVAASAVTYNSVPASTRPPGDTMQRPYPDSARGLKEELKDMRELARKHRRDRLQAMITNLEFSDARAWYFANFGSSGLETADYYRRDLKKSELQLADKMGEFAREDGYFSVTKQDAKKAYPGLITTPEVFLGAWENIQLYGEDPSETPVGYFFFVAGKFRWDSTIKWVTVD